MFTVVCLSDEADKNDHARWRKTSAREPLSDHSAEKIWRWASWWISSVDDQISDYIIKCCRDTRTAGSRRVVARSIWRFAARHYQSHMAAKSEAFLGGRCYVLHRIEEQRRFVASSHHTLRRGRLVTSGIAGESLLDTSAVP